MGLFGAIFDFDNNGTLDAFEETAEFGFFMQMMNDQQQAGLDPDDYDCD